jgi:hypothetical protein
VQWQRLKILLLLQTVPRACVGGKIESIPIAENEEYNSIMILKEELQWNSSDENRGSFVVIRYLSNRLSLNINKDQKTQLGQGNR